MKLHHSGKLSTSFTRFRRRLILIIAVLALTFSVFAERLSLGHFGEAHAERHTLSGYNKGALSNNTLMSFVANLAAFEVNSTADTDDGSCDALGTGTGNQDCTLREAINAANADAGTE